MKPTSIVKPSGQTTTFTHDNMGRITSQTDDVGTITFGYDNGDNPLTVTEGTAVLTRTFDNMGRVTSYTDASGNTVEYEWDKNGNLAEIRYPDNKTVTYTYDNHNRLKTVTDWANRVTTYHWGDAGRLICIDRPNGTTRNNQYTLGDDVARQRGDGAPQACPKGGLNRVPSGRDKPQLERYYERNGAGILQAYARFGYDLDSRIDWRYRLPKPQEMTLPSFTATYDNDNRVATWNSQSVTHDNDGNMTFGPLPGEEDFMNYNFDARNRLTGIGGVTYTYDSENNRIAKTTADGTTTYIFDPHGDALPRVLVRERPDESLTYYVYGIGLLYEVDEADNATYYHFDQSGSTIALTDDSGEVQYRFEYSPYGTLSHLQTPEGSYNQSDIPSSISHIPTPFLYAGQFGIHADENGLLHMRARYYSPELKRFINADPAGFGGGMNWYAYANNSPLMYVDPDGEVPILAAMLVGAVIGAGIDSLTTTLNDVYLGDGFNLGNTLRAALRGGVTGAVSVVATPASGSAIRILSSGANRVGLQGVRYGATGPFARTVGVVNTGIFGGGGGQIASNLTDSNRDWHQGALTATVAGAFGQGIGNRFFPTNNMSTIRQFNRTHSFSTNPSNWLQGNSGNFTKSTVTSGMVSGALNFK